MESDDEEEADIEDADLDVDHTNADEAGVQTTAISERQPHATAGTAAIYSEPDEAQVTVSRKLSQMLYV